MKKINICNRALHRAFSIRLLVNFLLLPTTALEAAKPTKPLPDPEAITIDLEGGYVKHMGFVPAGDEGMGFTNENIRHMAVSIGQLSGVNPETGQIIINEDNLLPLVSHELDVTRNAFFYTNVYIAGDTYIYGVLYGNGAGMSNIPSANITGSLTERPEIQQALQSKADSNGVWQTLNSCIADITALQLRTTLLEQGACDTNNPHQVSTEQLGALPNSGGSMSGHIDMSGVARIISLPEPINDQDAVPKCYLEKRLNYIEPQGDIGMGVYTNNPSL
jgi:hypothetical protein